MNWLFLYLSELNGFFFGRQMDFDLNGLLSLSLSLFFFTCQQRRRQPNRVWQGGVLLVLVGWSLTLKKSRCQRRTTSSPISPTKLSFASHRVGTFYIIILFLFCFVSCCPPPADVISFLTFLSCPLESPLSSTPFWP